MYQTVMDENINFTNTSLINLLNYNTICKKLNIMILNCYINEKLSESLEPSYSYKKL